MTGADHGHDERHAWDAAVYDRDFSFVAAYGETVLGWLDPRPDEGTVTFYPISLHLKPGPGPEDPPDVTVRGAKRVAHHAWKFPDY